jgi:hypothetical protein
MPRIGHYIALMLEGKLPAEYADSWKWRPGLACSSEQAGWHFDVTSEGVLPGKDFEELEGWAGSARHGVMAHTWGN